MKGNGQTGHTANSLSAFLNQLIDYAGIFPPASLSLEAAIRNYAAYRVSADAWMLGRFVIPAARLHELASYVSLFSREVPLTLSVIGQRSEHWQDCQAGLDAALEQISQFRQSHGELVEIGVLELPLPPVVPEREWLAAIAQAAADRQLQTFCELTIPRDAEWEGRMLQTLDAIANHNATGPELGVKLRTGGVTADAFPTPEQVAAVLIGCRDRQLGLKFTAGLHHPLRMYRSEVNAKMHGFVNVFAAGLLATAHRLDRATTVEILADEEAASFSFQEAGLSWRGLSLSTQEIARLRKSRFYSYGCCSFDEPREELRLLNLLGVREGME